VIIIDHDMDALFELAERVTVLQEGRVLVEGTPEEIKNNAMVMPTSRMRRLLEAQRRRPRQPICTASENKAAQRSVTGSLLMELFPWTSVRPARGAAAPQKRTES
jgi:ABC-type glutathione transport system ATPase component